MLELRHKLVLVTALIYSAVVMALLVVGVLFTNGGIWQFLLGCGLLFVIGWLFYLPSMGFPPNLVLIDKETFPRLNGIIGRIAAEIDAPAPPIMLVSGEHCALGLIGLRQRPLLVLSQPFLLRASDEERVALIAHEIGHLRDDAVARSSVHRVAYVALLRMMRVLDLFPCGELLTWPLRKCKQYLDMIRQTDSFQAELNADYWAAQLAGPMAARKALLRFTNNVTARTHPTQEIRLKAIDAMPLNPPTVVLSAVESSELAKELCQWPHVMQNRESEVRAEIERENPPQSQPALRNRTT